MVKNPKRNQLLKNSSRAIPFLVMAIALVFMSADTFFEYTINETTIQMIGIILTPLGVGGLVNKGFNVYRDGKKYASESGDGLEKTLEKLVEFAKKVK